MGWLVPTPVNGQIYWAIPENNNGRSNSINIESKVDQLWKNNIEVSNLLKKVNDISDKLYFSSYDYNETDLKYSILWIPQIRKLNMYSFYHKYKTPEYLSIHLQEDFLKTNFLPETSDKRFNYFNKKDLDKEFNGNYSYLDMMQDSISIYRPYNTKYIYDNIPSPHRFLLEGQKLDKKSAQAAFTLVKVEPIRKLDKPQKEIKFWSYSGEEVIQISQNHEKNWVKGGDNSFSLLSDLRATANYKKDKIAWDNKGIHKLGVNRTENERGRINNDLIQLTSKFGLSASKRWYYSAFFDFKTQFFFGRDKNDPSKILSGFMSPSYITSAIGMDYKESNNFTILISPVTSKITTVLDTVHVDPERYKIPFGKKVTTRSGASVNSHLNWKISSEFRLEYNLDLFYGYLNKNSETQLDWEIIFNMRINRFLSTRINAYVRYFENESNKIQFKENFSIAFSYRF